MKTKKLPNKMSKLLLLALTDLEKVEKDPRYKVDMGLWHSAGWRDGVCMVCLAGSVMAGTLGCDPAIDLVPAHVGGETQRKLEALDYLRVGMIHNAAEKLGIELPESLGERWDDYHMDPHVYRDDREGWWGDMLGLVGILQAEGL